MSIVFKHKCFVCGSDEACDCWEQIKRYDKPEIEYEMILPLSRFLTHLLHFWVLKQHGFKKAGFVFNQYTKSRIYFISEFQKWETPKLKNGKTMGSAAGFRISIATNSYELQDSCTHLWIPSRYKFLFKHLLKVKPKAEEKEI